ncbi:lysophospholipid acyltransferase family protein [Novosphingobium piscinae]|uniref:1-acyl-sn-glycerol-3-phosphate acyltransferase n=1 Tax=Novosphingobium piscinae TaxID=1507448 RepID=A0A7X1KP05_9SPHN|nr:lysophospholipid acyltransferase family protein [Novosphingobium piscinae]MBC2668249.1 1-acyl-sn-glycerol-3-phosphate acyltransferase [Novosphingobium piscinae]
MPPAGPVSPPSAAPPAWELTVPGRLRIALRLTLIVLALLVCVPLHYLYRAFAYGSPLPKLFLYLTTRIVGARLRVIGTPLRRDAFVLANHVSWIDIPALAGTSGTAFVAKAEVAGVPVIGWLCRLNRTVFVQREARLNVAEQINAVREALADNWSITVFPEGTTTDGWSLLPFKSSILKALDPAPAGILVQPVVIDYGAASAEIAWVGDEPGLTNALRVLARRGGFDLAVHYLDPFTPAEAGDRKAIAAEARRRIEARLEALRGGPLRPFGLPVEAVGYSARVAPTEG